MVPGGYGTGVDSFEHDVWAARNDELAGLLKVEDAVVSWCCTSTGPGAPTASSTPRRKARPVIYAVLAR